VKTVWIVSLTCCLLMACTVSTFAEDAHGSRSWRQSAIWDDGNAEFATYEISWQRYDRAYNGRAIIVLVKEPWAPDLQVKADTPRPDGFEVFKFNHLRDVPTGVYTYHQAATVFLRRDSGELLKIAASSVEACGISTAQMRDQVLETHSYFDTQGDRTVSWPNGAWPWAGLPAVLRDFVVGEPASTFNVFGTLMTSRFPELTDKSWKLTRHEPKRLSVPAGDYEGVAIELQHEDVSMTFVFDSVSPHTLLQYKDSRDSEYRLAKVERMPYWRMSKPGDEQWYPLHLRDGFTQ